MSHLTPPFTIALPMPTPGSPNAPHFKGERVTDFLDALEAHATAANIPQQNLPAYVLRYCHRRVRLIIESAPHWTEHDWAATRSYLIKLYASNERQPRISPDRLRKWVSLHAEARSFTKLQDVDRYYREFTAQSVPLTAANRITENETNLLFYRGIPRAMRKKIRHKIPANRQTATAAPSVVDVWGYLQDQFSEDDLDNDDDDVELPLDSEDDLDASDTEDEEQYVPRTPKKQKKKAKYNVTKVPGASSAPPPVPTSIETLTRQLEEMQLAQATFLQELSAVRSMNGNGGGYASGSAPMDERKCFICDGTNVHRLGIRNCPDVPRLIDEGLAIYAPSGRLIRPDGSELPRSSYGGGGVAKVLRDEHSASKSKSSTYHYDGTGPIKDTYYLARLTDQSPSSSKSSSFQYNDMGTIDDTYYMAYSSTAYSSSTSATDSQPQDIQQDFAKAARLLETQQTASLHSSTAPVVHSQVSQRTNQLSKMTTPCRFTKQPRFQGRSPAQPTIPFSTQRPSTTWDSSTELKTRGTTPTVISMSEDSLTDSSTTGTEVLGHQDEHIEEEIITATSTRCSSPILSTSARQTQQIEVSQQAPPLALQWVKTNPSHATLTALVSQDRRNENWTHRSREVKDLQEFSRQLSQVKVPLTHQQVLPSSTESRTVCARQIKDLQKFSINFGQRFPRPPQTPATSTFDSTTVTAGYEETSSRISVDNTPEDSPRTDDLNVTFDRTWYELEDLVHGDVVLVEPHEPLIVVPESVHIEELDGAEDSYTDTEDDTPASSTFNLHNTEDEDSEDVSLQYSLATELEGPRLLTKTAQSSTRLQLQTIH